MNLLRVFLLVLLQIFSSRLIQICRDDYSWSLESDRVEGASSFKPWKCRLQMLLAKIEVWEYVENEIPKPIDPIELATYSKEGSESEEYHY